MGQWPYIILTGEYAKVGILGCDPGADSGVVHWVRSNPPSPLPEASYVPTNTH